MSARRFVQAARAAEARGDARFHVRADSPAPLVAAIASATDRIEIVATVPLRVHSPLQVASDFFVLEAAFPGRVRLRVSEKAPRAPRALRLVDGDRAALARAGYERKLRELVRLLAGGDETSHAVPRGVRAPALELAESTRLHRALALEMGLTIA